MLTPLPLRPSAGGTVLQVLEDIIARGGQPQNIIVISVVAAPPALQKLSKFSGAFMTLASDSIVSSLQLCEGLGQSLKSVYFMQA